MMWGITGTPGTGKTSVSVELEKRGYPVVHLRDTVNNYIITRDLARDTLVVDIERWTAEFPSIDGIVEGHLAHHLLCDRIVVLRCRPDVLATRLKERHYGAEKIRENCEAEALDVILIETLELHAKDRIYELDTTHRSILETADWIEGFIDGKHPPTHGTINWSAYLGRIA